MNRQTFSSVFVIVLLATLAFTSCKSDPKPLSEEAKVSAETSVVRSRLRAEPNILNPVLTIKSQDLHVCNLVFPTLLNFNPETYDLAPVLAKSRPEKKILTEGPYKGGVAYTYEILEEAVWDNGTPVLASDYLFSIKALFNPLLDKANPYQGILKPLKEIEIDPENPKRFTVFVDQVFRSESTSGFYVYPEYVYDPNGLMKEFDLKELQDPAQLDALKTNPAIVQFAEFFSAQGTPGTIIESCGPYKVVEWETGKNLILEKKENWWGDKLADNNIMLQAYPKEIIFKAIPDDMAAITAMKNGQLDVVSKIKSSMFLDFKNSEAGKEYNFINPNIPMFNYMAFNTKKPHLSDKRVRRAIAHLVDVNEIIKTVQKGMAVRYAVPFPSNADYIDKNLKPIDFDVEKAKTLLEEAGWKDTDGDGVRDKIINGKKTPLQINLVITAKSEVSSNNAAIIKEDAIKAGVAIEPEVVTRAQLYRKRLPAREFDAFTLASLFDLDLFDPYQMWHTASDTPGGSNRAGFGNAETDAIIEEIRKTNDDVRRNERYVELQARIYDEQPWVTLYRPLDRVIINKKFKEAKTTLRSPGYTESLFR